MLVSSLTKIQVNQGLCLSDQILTEYHSVLALAQPVKNKVV